MFKRTNSVAALALAATLSAGVAGAAFAQASAAPTSSLQVVNQKLTGNTARIADVKLSQQGYVVIRASDASGKMTDNIVGFRALGPGDHKAVKVRLTGAHKAGETLWVTVNQNNGAKPADKRNKDNIGAPFMQDGKVMNQSFSTL